MISSLPLGYIFQAARLARLGRLLRFVKLLKLVRARRFRFPVGRLARAVGVAASVACAGAFALEAVEPETVHGLGEAMWWSTVTLSTVGYGDIAPLTGPGRLIGVVLMITGVGVFSYLAGLMASVVFDPEEDFIMETVVRVEAKLDKVLERLGQEGQ
jgi:voltage-gated potassium channel